MRVFAYTRADDGGRGDGDPDRFTRQSFWWLLGFGVFFYALCAMFVVHDLMAYKELIGGAAPRFWIGAHFGRVGGACLFFGLVLFLPAAAVWFLGRFFDANEGSI